MTTNSTVTTPVAPSEGHEEAPRRKFRPRPVKSNAIALQLTSALARAGLTRDSFPKATEPVKKPFKNKKFRGTKKPAGTPNRFDQRKHQEAASSTDSPKSPSAPHKRSRNRRFNRKARGGPQTSASQSPAKSSAPTPETAV